MADLSKIKDIAGSVGSKAKDAAVKGAEKGAKKAAKETGKAIDRKAQDKVGIYKKGRQAYKKFKEAKKKWGTVKAVANAARGLWGFIVSGPVGWLVGLVIIIIIGVSADAISDNLTMPEVQDASAIYSEGDLTDDELAAMFSQQCPTDDSSSSSSGSGTSSGTASDSDWTVEGSTAYKNAKAVFDSWVDKGLSGGAAAGIVGWVNSEGGFAMIGRAEGHYGNDPKTNSIKYGVVPAGLSYYTTEAGGGIYQFTPYTKYAKLGSDDWEDADKMNEFVGKAVAAGDWNASMDLSGKNRTFRQMAEENDPESATLAWQAYERGNVAYIHQDQKKSDARKAYELFDGSKYKFDKAKFEKHFGSGDAGGSASSSGSDSNSSSSENMCKQSSGGGNGWSEDGTGEVNYRDHQAWRPDELPNDLKQYALDPKSLGMKYKSSEGWMWAGGQCTNLSASLMYALWEKDGQHPTQRQGNGNQVVGNWVSTFGGKSTDKPTSGAVFSSGPGEGSGHTGVVSHVFKNGDILIVEQNYSTLSGEGSPDMSGTGYVANTWNYRYVTKDAMKSGGFSFYDPSANGYKVVKDAKSL